MCYCGSPHPHFLNCKRQNLIDGPVVKGPLLMFSSLPVVPDSEVIAHEESVRTRAWMCSNERCRIHPREKLPAYSTNIKGRSQGPWDLLVPQCALWGHLLKGNPQRKACSDYIVYFSHICRVRGGWPLGISHQPVSSSHRDTRDCLIDL